MWSHREASASLGPPPRQNFTPIFRSASYQEAVSPFPFLIRWVVVGKRHSVRPLFGVKSNGTDYRNPLKHCQPNDNERLFAHPIR